jgi:transposase
LRRIRRPAVQHLAIDLGGKESQICIRDKAENILEERKVLTRRLGEYLSKQPASRVIVETSAEAFAVADLARSAGHDVRVVPATLAPSLGVGARGIKTDRRDAQVLSEVSCRVELRSVHIPSQQAREWRAISNSRDALVSSRTKLTNTVKSQLRGRLVLTNKRRSAATPAQIRTLWTELVGEVPAHVERLLVLIEAIDLQVKDAEKQIRQLVKGNAICLRLMTVPGVGPITAMRYVATLDDIKRFSTAHDVQSYLGLTPGENSSSTRRQRTHLTKAGSPQMRWLLVQAAWSAQRSAPTHPMVLWTKQVAERRGRRIAAVALARKLAGILFAIWRDNTTYSSKLGAA